MGSTKSHSKNVVSNALSKPMSRRHFFGLGAATGALALVGTTKVNNTIVAAYADENDQYFYKVVDVKRSQVPVFATYIDKGKRYPVEDATIKFKNRGGKHGSQKELVVKTDADGLALPELAIYAEDCVLCKDCYDGVVSFSATKEGYQSYEHLYRPFLTGIPNSEDDKGTMIEIPMAKDNPNTPYVSCFSMNGSDIGHFTQEIGITDKNTDNFDIFVRMRNLPKNTEIKCSLLSDRKAIPIQSNDSKTIILPSETEAKTTTDENGIAEVAIKGKWFTGVGKMPKQGSRLAISVEINDKNIKLAPKTKLINPKYPFVEDEKEQFAFRFDGEETNFTGVKEDSKHCFREQYNSFTKEHLSMISGSFPWCPISVEWYANGEIWIFFNLFSHPFKKWAWDGMKRTDEPSDRNRKSFKDQCTTWQKYWDKKLKNKEKIKNGTFWDQFDESFFKKRPLTTEINFTVKGDVLIILTHKYDDKSHTNIYTGAGRLRGSIGASFALTEHWMAGPVPVNLKLEASAKFLAAWELGFILKYLKKQEGGFAIPKSQYLKHPYHSHLTTKFIFQIWIDIAFSGGVGIRGFLGLFIRAFFWWRHNSELVLIGENGEMGASTVGKITIGVEVVVEVVMCEIKLWCRKFLNDKKVFEAPKKKGEDRIDSEVVKGLFGGAPLNKFDLDYIPVPKVITETVLRNAVEKSAKLNKFGVVSEYKNVEANGKDRYLTKIPPINVIDSYDEKNNSVTYNPIHGIRTNLDTPICKDVLFASHMKTFMCEGNLYLLRLSAVEIELPDDFDIYSSHGCSLAIPKSSVKLPSVKRDASGNVVFDAKGQIQYDIPDGIDPNTVAKYADDCFGLSGSETKEEREKLINNYFKNEDAEAKRFNAFAASANKSNGAGAKVVRTRITCAKFDSDTMEWGYPRVVEFQDSSGIAYYNRYNSFDVDMDATAKGCQNGRVAIVVSTVPRDLSLGEPTYENMIDHIHTYKLKYNLVTGLVEDQEYFGGQDACQAPRISDADALSYCRRQSTRTVRKDLLGMNIVSNTRIRPEHLTNHTMNLSYNIIDKVNDVRFTNGLHNGFSENFFVDAEKQDRVFSAWYTQDERTVGECGFAVFWASNLATDASGKETVNHDFVYKVNGIENVTYLGTAVDEKDNSKKVVKYLLTNKPDENKTKYYSTVSFKFDAKTGVFDSKIEEPVLDTLGNAQFGTMCRGEDTNHLYATRVSMDPKDTFGDSMAGRNQDEPNEIEDYQTVSWGPWTSEITESNDEKKSGAMYQLVAARYDQYNNTYLDPFPLMKLDFVPDSISLLGIDDEGSKYFVITSITNSDLALGDIYMAKVPLNLLVTSPIAPTLCNENIRAGEESKVDITVANTGNLPVSQFHVKLYEEQSGDILFDDTITDLKSHLDITDVTNFKPVFKDGKMTGEFKLATNVADEAGLLWPGTDRAFTIPYTISKEDYKKFTLVAEVSCADCDKKYLYKNELNGNILKLNHREPVSVTTDLSDPSTSNAFPTPGGNPDPTVMPIDYVYEDAKGKIISETEKASVGNDSPLDHSYTTTASYDTDGESSSNTSDGSLGSLFGAAALGAVGAGLAAYTKRRSENEDSE